MINHFYKCIFIHIPKCAGLSINRSFGVGARGHQTAFELQNREKEIFDSYFKFAFVRNTWARVVSAYHFLITMPVGKLYRQEVKPRSRESFNDYVERISQLTPRRTASRENLRTGLFFLSQLSYLTIDSKIAVDFVGKVENLEEDFRHVCQQIGKPWSPLPHINRTEHGPFQGYYTPRTRGLVYDFFREEIEFFGFKFDDESPCRIKIL